MTDPSMPSSVHPVFADLLQIPGLENLAQKLKEKLSINQDCEPKRLTLEEKKTKAIWNYERKKYLKAKLADHYLQELIMEYEVKEIDSKEAISHEEKAAMTSLAESLTNAELSDFGKLVGPTENEPNLLLGLTKEDLNIKPLDPHSKSFVSQKLEENLFHDCLEISDQIQGQNEDSMSTKEKFEKIRTLPDMIRTEWENVRTSEMKQRKDKEEEMKNNLSLMATVSKNVAILETLATKFKLRQKAESDDITSEYLSVKCKVLVLKLKCLEQEVMMKTYKPESVRALKTIANHLTAKIRATQESIEQTKSNLVQYDAVGEDFKEIVDEYAKVQVQIEGKKWALRELKETV